MPPEIDVIPELNLDQLLVRWQLSGLTCESKVGGTPDNAAGFSIHCEGTNTPSNIDAGADAIYWTPSGIQSFSILVNPLDGGEVNAISAFQAWIAPFADIVGGEAATAWLSDHVGDEACKLGCQEQFGGVTFAYYSGRQGAQKLSVGTP